MTGAPADAFNPYWLLDYLDLGTGFLLLTAARRSGPVGCNVTATCSDATAVAVGQSQGLRSDSGVGMFLTGIIHCSCPSRKGGRLARAP